MHPAQAVEIATDFVTWPISEAHVIIAYADLVPGEEVTSKAIQAEVFGLGFGLGEFIYEQQVIFLA